MSKRQLVYVGLDFRGAVWAGDLNLRVTDIQVGLKCTKQEENPEEGWAAGKGNVGARAILIHSR